MVTERCNEMSEIYLVFDLEILEIRLLLRCVNRNGWLSVRIILLTAVLVHHEGMTNQCCVFISPPPPPPLPRTSSLSPLFWIRYPVLTSVRWFMSSKLFLWTWFVFYKVCSPLPWQRNFADLFQELWWQSSLASHKNNYHTKCCFQSRQRSHLWENTNMPWRRTSLRCFSPSFSFYGISIIPSCWKGFLEKDVWGYCVSRRQSMTVSPQPWARKGDDHSWIKGLESLRRSGAQHTAANGFIKLQHLQEGYINITVYCMLKMLKIYFVPEWD